MNLTLLDEGGPETAAFTAEQLTLIDQLIAAHFSSLSEPPQSEAASDPSSSVLAIGKSLLPSGCCWGQVLMLVHCTKCFATMAAILSSPSL